MPKQRKRSGAEADLYRQCRSKRARRQRCVEEQLETTWKECYRQQKESRANAYVPRERRARSTIDNQRSRSRRRAASPPAKTDEPRPDATAAAAERPLTPRDDVLREATPQRRGRRRSFAARFLRSRRPRSTSRSFTRRRPVGTTAVQQRPQMPPHALLLPPRILLPPHLIALPPSNVAQIKPTKRTQPTDVQQERVDAFRVEAVALVARKDAKLVAFFEFGEADRARFGGAG